MTILEFVSLHGNGFNKPVSKSQAARLIKQGAVKIRIKDSKTFTKVLWELPKNK